MKILMVNKFLYPNGGSETYIFELGKSLVKAGHEVQFFGMEHEGRCVSNRVNAYTSTMDFHSGSAISKLLYPFKTIYSTEARKKIRLVLDDFQPDVVHLNNFNYQLTPSIILEIRAWEKKAGKKCRIIYTAHDYQLICPNHMLFNPGTGKVCENCLGGHFGECVKGRCIHGSKARSLIGSLEAKYWNGRNVYAQIDKIICCSEFLKTKMDTNPVLAERTIAIHNFLNASPTTTAKKKDYVLYFGRMSEEKGVRTLLFAAKELENIHFIFAGKGPIEDEVKEAADKYSNIEFLGFVTGEPLKQLIREAQFSIYPSEWYENCPYSVMESQAYGTPVIGANIGGIPELIRAGIPDSELDKTKTGMLFESGNAEDLKEKIKWLYGDEAVKNAYAKGCQSVTWFDADTYTKELVEKIYV